MFKVQQYVKSVYSLKEMPELRLPEIILCGRSNVGKSSFINSFFSRKNLAKTSSDPGKTRSLNYYLIENKFYMVDLPGYGYAKAGMAEREKWGKLVAEFLGKSGFITLAIHLMDSRHKPSVLDINLNSLLKNYNIPFIVIMNKSDKLKQGELAAAKNNVTEAFPELIYGENLFFYSSLKKTGRSEVFKIISAIFP
jgi:GTP-binding protein